MKLLPLILTAALSILVASNFCFADNQGMSANQMQFETALAVSNATDNASTSTESDEPSASWSGKAQEVLINALSLTGIKYSYGGKSPETGFDCSGFVRYVFMQATNLSLPPTARAISQIGRAVSKDKLQPGDLVFFNTLKSTFSHVGIYIGDNRFIHSPRTGGVVRVENMNEAYWTKNYNGAKRVDDVSADK